MKLFIKWNTRGGVHYIIYCGCSNSGIPRAQTWRPIWQSSHELSSHPYLTTIPEKEKEWYIFSLPSKHVRTRHTLHPYLYDGVMILYSAFCPLQQILSGRNLVDHVWRRTSYNNNNNNNNNMYCTLYICTRYVSRTRAAIRHIIRETVKHGIAVDDIMQFE